MNYVQLVTTTVTYANEGRDILKEHGIKSDIKKVQATSAGCLFGIVVVGNDLKKASELLKDNGIKIIAVKELKV